LTFLLFAAPGAAKQTSPGCAVRYVRIAQWHSNLLNAGDAARYGAAELQLCFAISKLLQDAASFATAAHACHEQTVAEEMQSTL
jgi:hypothetical protein